MQVYSTFVFIRALSPKAPTVGAPPYRGRPCASLPTGIVGKGREQDAEALRLALNKNKRTLNPASSGILGISEFVSLSL